MKLEVPGRRERLAPFSPAVLLRLSHVVEEREWRMASENAINEPPSVPECEGMYN